MGDNISNRVYFHEYVKSDRYTGDLVINITDHYPDLPLDVQKQDRWHVTTNAPLYFRHPKCDKFSKALKLVADFIEKVGC